MKVEKRIIFRCEYCNKTLLHKSSMENHEMLCKKKPEIQILCSICHFSEYTKERFIFNDINYEFNFRYCSKRKRKMIPSKAANSEYYADALKGKYDQIMPTVSIGCTDYLSKKNINKSFEKAKEKMLKLLDFAGAVEDYNKIIKLDPNCMRAYLDRGEAKMSLKDYVSAIEDFNKVLEIAPDHIWAYNCCIEAYELLNDHESAKEMKERKLIAESKLNDGDLQF